MGLSGEAVQRWGDHQRPELRDVRENEKEGRNWKETEEA